MIRVGIIGGTGYAAGELIRILIYHPDAEIVYVLSNSRNGDPVTAVHRDLEGETDLRFTGDPSEETDVVFLCLPHGKSREFLDKHSLPGEVQIIDLSRDFRTDYDNRREFVYGLTELQRAKIRSARNIANPGCFATAIQLALLPLVKERLISGDVQVSAITGATGAGRTPRDTTHFSWRSGNASVYKPFVHQHLGEIGHNLRSLDPGFGSRINFIPYRGSFTRGILAAVYLQCDLSKNQANALYTGYYDEHPFTHISPVNTAVKQVVNTNKCLLYLEKHEDNLLIISAIDNLVKGASGQAVQNMNVMSGLDETTGLQLKSSVY